MSACSVIEGGQQCTGTAGPRGWCGPHYQRWYRYGSPLISKAKRPPTPEERAWSREHGRIPLRDKDNAIVAYALVDPPDCDELTRFRWYLNGGGYVVSSEPGAVVYMHRYLLGLHDSRRVDHINGNKRDNRRTNLRFATPSQNGQNRKGLDANNTSGYRGVSIDRRSGRWRAYAILDGKQHELGLFLDVNEAGKVAAAFRAANMSYSSEARS